MSKGEDRIIEILQQAHIDFEREKTFPDLKRKGLLRFDFFCPNLFGQDTIIEYDGEFHFKPIKGRQQLIKQQEYDRRKNSYCLAYHIKLIRIPYWDLDKLEYDYIFNTPNLVVSNKWHNDILLRSVT